MPRTVWVGVAGLLAATDLVFKTIATDALADGHAVDLGLLQLRRAYNRGVAFGEGATVSPVVVLTLTALATAVLAVHAGRSAPATRPVELAGLAMLLVGVVADLVDRAGDGVDTDYLHTGWWPTFNLADTHQLGCRPAHPRRSLSVRARRDRPDRRKSLGTWRSCRGSAWPTVPAACGPEW